ncbi:UNVERIFIED_CONTAM: hypothetical protein Sangu_1734900 [Sesamum angustifolium]|uniref:Ternary complex factor MIP1 leucine-zipper domain-containing protein n=1 Tax=Sesamum angustifolium TaxID=2727405 RepID=A0AAW2M4Y2_9LAMI
MSKRVKENSGLVVEEGKEKARRDSSARSTLSYAQHRRSQSASDKSLNLPRVGGSYCKRKDPNESADLVPSTSSCRATPLHKNSCSTKDDISNHRVSLEQDHCVKRVVGQILQTVLFCSVQSGIILTDGRLRAKQEVGVNKLKLSFYIIASYSFKFSFASVENKASRHQDLITILLQSTFTTEQMLSLYPYLIEQLHLRLQQEKSMRVVLEKAIGRASSTLSPGHRHFAAQTKELIAEIELLEEEVATREQHVLSLYRSIFENCVSQPTSEHSSVVTSRAHAKSESRKHPSIISSAFCSSIKFRLRKLDSLVTVNDSAKRSFLQTKTRHASLLNAKGDMQFEKSCTDHVKARILFHLLGLCYS